MSLRKILYVAFFMGVTGGAFAATKPAESEMALWHLSLPDLTQAQSENSKAVKVAVDQSNALTPLATVPLPESTDRDVVSLVAPTSLWSRIRAGFGMRDIIGPQVIANENWYADRPNYVIRMVDRSRKYIFHIVEALEKRNMPTELALLPFIESAYNPHAVSSANAVGIWQFMPATGRTFDLVQNVFRDDRKNVISSTDAALDYLQKLHKMFGTWDLALAAYNWGEGSVSRAIAKNEKRGLPTNYASLNLPQETRDYLPKLQAVKNIILDPQAFGSVLPSVGNHPYFESVTITHDMDVAMIAKLAEITVDDFKSLNPGLNRPVVLAEGNPVILLPWDNAKTFRENLIAHGDKNLSSWTVWMTPKTLKPSEIAYKFDMSEEDFRSINKIPPRMLVKAGSAVLVPTEKAMVPNVGQGIANSGHIAVAPEMKTRLIFVHARRGDSIEKIARRYHLAASEVAEWNHLKIDSRLAVGKQIKLQLPSIKKKNKKEIRHERYAHSHKKESAKKMVKNRREVPHRPKVMHKLGGVKNKKKERAA